MPEPFTSRISPFGHAGLWTVLFTISAAAWAQGVVGRSVDIAVNAGTNNLSANDSSYHPEYGASLGYNFSSHFAVLGEYNYLSLGVYRVPLTLTPNSTLKMSGNYQWAGGSVRYAPLHSSRIVPYVVGGGGCARESAAASVIGAGASATDTNGSNGVYVSAGGGVSLFGGRNWGVRPEVRWDRQFYGSGNDNFNIRISDVRGTLALFYQWPRPDRYY
ncbi:MAG TPA: outer membrane beta-barrel protein [Acidobacteriaceae bacterium]